MKFAIVILLLFFPVLIFSYQTLGNVSSDLVLDSGTYLVNSICVIDYDATLTINSGVVIKFALNKDIFVKGTLISNGTADNNVVFTSINDNSVGEIIENSTGSPQHGDWREIRIDGSSYYVGTAHINYTQIKYGGYLRTWANKANLTLNEASVILTNSEISYCDNDGIYGIESTISLTNNNFVSNNGYAVKLEDCQIGFLQNNDASLNIKDIISISGELTETQTWDSSGTAIIGLNSDLETDYGINLTIDPGTVIKSSDRGNLKIYGEFSAIGSEESPIVFTSENDDLYGGDSVNDTLNTLPQPADWESIVVIGSTSSTANADFLNCVFRYGGGVTSTKGLLDLHNYSAVEVDSCRFEFGNSHGITSVDAKISIKNSFFSSNGSYATNLKTTEFSGFENNSCANNGSDLFGIHGNFNESQILPVINSGSYYMIGRIEIERGVAVTIEPGVIIKASRYSYFNNNNFDIRGSLIAIGTVDEPIIFTSYKDDTYAGDTNNDGNETTPEMGDWDGICVSGLGSNEGVLRMNNCKVLYGGKSSTNQNNIKILANSDVIIENSQISSSQMYGISIIDANPIIKQTTISNNASYGILISGNSTPVIGDIDSETFCNTFLSNDSGGFQVYNQTSNDIEAYHNSWGVAPEEIDLHIYDDDENPEYGEVLFNSGNVGIPPKVQNLQIDFIQGNVLLTWDSLTEYPNGTPIIIDSYSIQSSSDPDFESYSTIGSTLSTEYTHINDTNNKILFYRVVAIIGT